MYNQNPNEDTGLFSILLDTGECVPARYDCGTLTTLSGTVIDAAGWTDEDWATRTDCCPTCVECPPVDALAFQATIGRPDNSVSWQYGDVYGATFAEFTTAMLAAGFTTYIAGPTNEAHFFAPCTGAEFVVDGISQGVPLCVPNPNADDPTESLRVQLDDCTLAALPTSAALQEVCALVDGTPALVTPLVVITGGVITSTVYTDQYGQPIVGTVTANPDPASCLCP